VRITKRLAPLALSAALLTGGVLALGAPTASAATTYSCSGAYQISGPSGQYQGWALTFGYYTGDDYVPTDGGWSDAAIEAQCLLNTLGYGLTVDGYYGPNTQAAVANFQSQHSLSADGYVGPNTWPALRYYTANQSSCYPPAASAATTARTRSAMVPMGC
jgi:peptidoglycan hydrolase-like protein with peptidoglycan-binding domain